LKANIKEHSFENITVKRGQLVTSRKSLSESLGISEQSIRTSLKRLKSTNEITIETTRKYSIITVLNYNKYQDVTNTLTNNQPTANQQLTTIKECKNEKNNIVEQAQTANTSEISEIIDYLNLKSGKNFMKSSKATQSHIKARLNEGYSVEDFKKVIDRKCEQWLSDDRMCDYVRPKTLFGTNFESYLNESTPSKHQDFAGYPLIQRSDTND
jgi:uncharacterized phage protein (TIGR02220 family)